MLAKDVSDFSACDLRQRANNIDTERRHPGCISSSKTTAYPDKPLGIRWIFQSSDTVDPALSRSEIHPISMVDVQFYLVVVGFHS
jgi:hypothetical protein